MDNEIKYVLINGYTTTGSSAVVNLLEEFSGIYSPNREFRLIKDPHGIIDLDRNLNDSLDSLNADNAIRDFEKFVFTYNKKGGAFRSFGMGYCDWLNPDLQQITREYLDGLVDHKYHGYWWYLETHKHYLQYIFEKIMKKIRIYDCRKYSYMNLYCKTDKEFIERTQEYINRIFRSITDKLPYKIDTVVLDQPIPANRPNCAKRYFKKYKVIVVERDPRDVYIDLINEEKKYGDIVGHVGFDVAKSHNVELFVDWFKIQRKNICSEIDDKNYMKLYFEDIILNYDNTKKNICDFIYIPAERHVNPKKYLKPEISRKNVGIWKEYPYQDEIKVIEDKLKDYIYLN